MTSQPTRRLAVLTALLTFTAGAVLAQALPAKPVRIVVPFPPGGATDVVARALGDKLQARLGQTVTIDNKPGASTLIGADAVAKAPGDGTVLLVSGSTTFSVAPALKAQMPYDHRKDLALIGVVAKVPLVVVVASGSPARTLADFIAQARAKPGELNYATFGPGTAPHLAGEQLFHEAGVRLLPVPYRGSGPATLATIGGEVQLGIDTLTAVLPHLKSGKLRALALLDSHRAAALPEVATVAELKLPRATFEAYYGVAAPGSTPPALVQALAREVAAAMAQADVKERFAAAGLDAVWQDGAAFQARTAADVAAFTAVGKRSNITLD